MLIGARIATGWRTGLAVIIILALGACTLTSDARRPNLLGITAGDAQTAPAGTELEVPLGVIVLDQFSVAVENITVTWAITSGGGSLSAASTTTDASGVTSVTYIAGPTAGDATITATVPQIGTVTFKETIT
jgi:hypothetical protein